VIMNIGAKENTPAILSNLAQKVFSTGQTNIMVRAVIISVKTNMPASKPLMKAHAMYLATDTESGV
jgi:hypothetical protein